MNYTQKEQDAIVLDGIEELTYKARFHVTDGFRQSSPLQKHVDFLIKTFGDGVYNKIRDKFYSEEYRKRLLCGLERRGITCVTYFSETYPEVLRQTPLPPLVLYCKGNTALLKERMFGIVGSRRTQAIILKSCSAISAQIAEKFVVVTGTAEGADTAAAEGALESGRLICVAAQGLDSVFPASNAKLYKMVAERGLLITEQPPPVTARGYLFPIRNRLIAALCEGVLIVSAGERSGASITAAYAFEYGKDVFCFPYSAGIPSGAGCNALIKKGAYLTENILDIFGAYGLDFNAQKETELTDTEGRLLSVIRERGTAHIEEIAADAGLRPYEILAVLSSLEVKGMVARMGGNRYAVVRYK